ncbi:hypothetical protein ACFVAF_04210 [Streptomyces sp. NPDC057596]|uniref:hypothetical protein n=1 Tax=Streptomyces sp. NPDC057596 TaxID=3346178 RepID=UPI00369909B0
MTAVFDPAMVAAQLTGHLDERPRCKRHPEQVLPCQHMTCRLPGEPQPARDMGDEVDETDEPGKDDKPESELARKLATLKTPDAIWKHSHMRYVEKVAKSVGVKREGVFVRIGNRAAVLAGPNVCGSINERGTFPLTTINVMVGRSGAGSNVTARAVDRALPVPAKLLTPPPTIETADQVNDVDWGYKALKPATGSALLANMQRLVQVTLEEDADPVIAYLPRVELSYTEGETLLGTMNKSKSSGSQGAAIAPYILDGYFGDPLQYDITKSDERAPIPARVYTMATNAYFQIEFIGTVMDQTTGFVQRANFVPLMKERGDEERIAAARELINGGAVSPKERERLLASLGEQPKHPGPLKGAEEFLTQIPGARSTPKKVMRMCATMTEEIALIQAGIDEGLAQDDPESSHKAVAMYRIAAQSALMRYSHDINEDDWAIAKAFSALDQQTREVCREWGALIRQKDDAEDNAKTARRTRTAEDQRAFQRGEHTSVAKKVGRVLREYVREEPRTGKQMADRIAKEDVGYWALISGGGTKTTLRDAAVRCAGIAKVGTRYVLPPES